MPVNSPLTATEITRLNAGNATVPVYLSFEPETEVGHATVNGTPSSFPVTTIAVTGATAGWTNQRAAQRVKITDSTGTILRGYYRNRKVGDITHLYVNEIMNADPGLISILARTGGIQNGDICTIYECYDLWSRKPYTATYQDVDIAVGSASTGYNTLPYPIVNMTINGQPGDFAANVTLGGTQALTATVTVTKHATLAGSVDTYAWSYPASFTGVSGQGTATLTATAPVGSHHIYCAVTDSLGGTITVSRWIRVHDPSDPPLAIFPPSSDVRDLQGRRMTVRLKQSTISVIPPGARCIVWSDGTWNGLDVSSATKKFIGFAANTPFTLQPGYYESQLEIIGPAGILDRLHGYPTTFGFTGVAASWETLNVNLSTVHFMMWWVLQWRCVNFLTTFNYTPISTSLSTNLRKTVNIPPGSIYSQLKYLAAMMDANAGCRSDGEMVCASHPSMLYDRSGVITRATLDYSQYSITQPAWQRRPAVGTARWEGYLSSVYTDTKLISQAPGEDTLGQYDGQTTGNEKVFADQTDANHHSGLALAKANNEYPQIPIELPTNFDVFEPVDMQRVVLQVPASKSPTKSAISITAIPTSVTKQWPGGQRAKLQMQCEAETNGVDGVTIVVPVQATSASGYSATPAPKTTAVSGLGTPTHNGGTAIGLENSNIGYSNSLLNSVVTWTKLTPSGVTGTYLALLFDPFSDFLGPAQTGNLGAWLLTTTGLWYSNNILSLTPIFTLKNSLSPGVTSGTLRAPIWAQGVIYVAWVKESSPGATDSQVYVKKLSAYGATADWSNTLGTAHNSAASLGMDINQYSSDECLAAARDNGLALTSIYRITNGTPSRITTTSVNDAGIPFIQKPLYTFAGASNTSTGASESLIYSRLATGGATASVWKTADGGATSTDISPTNTNIRFSASSVAFTNDANRLMFGGWYNTQHLFTSTDAGANWTDRGGSSASVGVAGGYFPRTMSGNYGLYLVGNTLLTFSPDFGVTLNNVTGNWNTAVGAISQFQTLLPIY